MKVSKGKIPSPSLVSKYLPVNYSDVYVCAMPGAKNVAPDDILISIWTVMPGWVNKLFKIRNFIVKPFGLKSDEGDMSKIEECIRTGGSYSIVSVPDKSENETILCLTDKHLTAYLSVHIDSIAEEKIVSMTTLVNFHNKLGYIYFYTIYPFHHLVVKSMLKNTIRRLSE